MRLFRGLSFKVLVFVSVFTICWILGALRFQWNFATLIYGVLNIPFGVLFLYLDNYLWINYPSSSWLNNEFVSGLIWCITVFCQGEMYYLLIKFLKRNRYEKSRKIGR